MAAPNFAKVPNVISGDFYGKEALRIIQCSPGRTGSTVLTNALCGLICPADPVHYVNQLVMDDKIVRKTHIIEIDDWIQKFQDEYDLYFVCSERVSVGLIDTKYHVYSNVMIISYDELLCTLTYTNAHLIENLSRRLRTFLPEITLHPQTAIKRLEAMNETCEKIKDLPFSYYDEFFHVHGSHRNRCVNHESE